MDVNEIYEKCQTRDKYCRPKACRFCPLSLGQANFPSEKKALLPHPDDEITLEDVLYDRQRRIRRGDVSEGYNTYPGDAVEELYYG